MGFYDRIRNPDQENTFEFTNYKPYYFNKTVLHIAISEDQAWE